MDKTRCTPQRGTISNKPSRRPPARGGPSRYSARYLILMYSNTPERFDPLEIERLVTQEQGQCTIVRGSLCLENGAVGDVTTSFLVFIDFAGKRFQTRNLGLFDVQGLHPRWLHVRSSPWQKLDELMSSGEVVWDGIFSSQDQGTKSAATPMQWLQGISSSASSSAAAALAQGPFCGDTSDGNAVPSSEWEFIGSSSNEMEILEICAEHSQSSWAPLQQEWPADFESTSPGLGVDMPVKDKQDDCPGFDHVQGNELVVDVESWKAGYRNGYKDAFSDIKTMRRDPADLTSN